MNDIDILDKLTFIKEIKQFLKLTLKQLHDEKYYKLSIHHAETLRDAFQDCEALIEPILDELKNYYNRGDVDYNSK